MENTEKLMFEDDEAQWYVAAGADWVGPFSSSEIYSRVTSGQLNWAHYVWKQGQSEWKRICDIKIFKALVPESPKSDLISQIKEKSKSDIKPPKGPRSAPPPPSKDMLGDAEKKEWFLFYDHSQFGPFDEKEIAHSLKSGKINPRVHAWRDGMEHWERLQDLESFKELCEVEKPKPALVSKKSAQAKKVEAVAAEPAESRSAPRRPLVARITFADDKHVAVGVCRDISVGGMQVLTDRIPGKPGAKIKLNVSPTGPEKITPFVAEGVIVRVLEDGRGFSFRFSKLVDESKRAIDQYFSA